MTGLFNHNIYHLVSIAIDTWDCKLLFEK